MKLLIKKILANTLSICIIFASLVAVMLTTGCTYKTYDLVGIVDLETDKIVYYDDLTDEQKGYIDTYSNFKIKLGVRNDITISYEIYEGPLTITYTFKGTYTLEGDVLNIKTKQDGKEYTTPEQYTDGKIIYYMGEFDCYFVFA